ncbi:MAG: hypothetical protein K8R53_01300, partial [Bacteroidales bacterium]|nr:hypothetical protein [Bacteroidales bacterium]
SGKRKWKWYYMDVPHDKPLTAIIKLKKSEENKSWKGSISSWMLIEHEHDIHRMSIEPDGRPVPTILPPRPRNLGMFYWAYRIGHTKEITLK